MINGAGGTNPNLSIRARFTLTGGETYRFSSLSVTGTMPAGYDQIFTNAGYNRFEMNGEAGDPTQTLPDPGVWITIVPEPTSAALLGIGGLLATRRRRG